MNGKFILMVSVVGLLTTSPIHSKELKLDKLPAPQIHGTDVSFALKNNQKNTTLSITGPNGFTASKFSENGSPKVDLYRAGKLADGLYNFEITTPVGKLVLIKDTINNGRGENNSHYARKGVIKSGHFRVINGQIKKYPNIKEPQLRYYQETNND
jgi:hypothetical protein